MSEKLEFDLSVKGGNNNGLSNALANATTKSDELTSSLKLAAGVFTGNVATAALSKLTSTLSSATDESVKFKRAQLEIETILPENSKLTKELTAELVNLSKQYGTTATSQAKAYYEIISAGVSDATDGALLLKRANELATGGLSDTGETIDLLTTIYNVYGKEIAIAEEASDSLFKTVQIGKTTIPELSQSLGEVLPVAKNLGIGLDEVGAGLARLTNAGFKTNEAGTLLNALFAAIARNGKELGPTMNSTAVQTEGLGVVIQRIAEKTNLSSDALFTLLGRQEAVKAVISLSKGGLEEYNKTLDLYSTKAGVAAAASAKILSEDTGKQFDIFSSKILDVGRSLVDTFVPAVNASIKAINNLLGADLSGDLLTNIKTIENQIDVLDSSFAAGTISQSAYAAETANLNRNLVSLKNAVFDNKTPLDAFSIQLENESKRIKGAISDVRDGITGLTLGPIEKSIALDSLNSQLDAVSLKIKNLKTENVTPNTVNIAPVTKTKDQVKLQAEISSLNKQFAIEEQALKDNIANTNIENDQIRRQAEIDALYEHENLKLSVFTEAELAKADFIKNDQNTKLKQDAIYADAQLKAIRIFSKKELDEKQFINNEKKKSDDNYKANLGSTLDQIATLQTSGNKTLVAVGKAAALSQIAISGPVAVAKAFELGPILGPIAATAVAASVAAQAAKVVGVQFENGGIVGQQGASSGADNRVATIRDGELILNGQQQKTLFDAINSGNLGGGNIQVIIDGKEIAVAVRNQIQGGFRLS